MLSVSLLGDFRLSADGASVDQSTSPRQQSLLAYLLLHRDAPQSRAYLAFLFWPDTCEAQARTNLRNLLHQLRHALPRLEDHLDIGTQSLRWRQDSDSTLDVADFRAALAEAQHAQSRNATGVVRDALDRALAVYRGDLLPSCYDDWIIPLREQLRSEYCDALARLVHLLEAEGDFRGAILQAQSMLRFDPLRESSYRCLMRLHALDGDRAGALGVYHTCTTVLRRELDVEPSSSTQEVYEQLIRLEAEPRRGTPSPAHIPLVGRKREWSQLLGFWRSAASGRPQMVLLRGEAGIGKTRLSEEMVQWATRQGIATAGARCYAAEGQLPYAPVITWLRARPLGHLDDASLVEVARLLPEVVGERPGLPRPAQLRESWQREQLFEALARAVVGTGKPLLLAIDDLQWCDRDTLEWLHFLLRYKQQGRFLILSAYRPEEVAAAHPLTTLWRELRAEGCAEEIEIPPLDESGTKELASRIVGREIGPDVARLLHAETEGIPLFVVETARAGLHNTRQDTVAVTSRLLCDSDFVGPLGVPPKVRSVLEARLAQLSPAALDLAGLAATIGREFSYALLEKASQIEEPILIQALDELWEHRIIREKGSEAYDFSHDKLREAAYLRLSAARHRLLHRHVAQALEVLHCGCLEAVSHQVAVHYERAGLPDASIPYYMRAADAAREVCANQEAIGLLRHGMELAQRKLSESGGERSGADATPTSSGMLVVQIHEALGDVLESTTAHSDACEAYRSALERVTADDRIRRGRLHRKASRSLREMRRYTDALDASRSAEVALGEPPGHEPSVWWDEWIEVQLDRVWSYYWLARWPEMGELVDRVRSAVQERAEGYNRLRFLLASCLLHLRRDRYRVSSEMLQDSREALALSQAWGDRRTKIDCRFELGFLLLWRRELEEAREHLQTALELAEIAKFLPSRTLSLTYLAVLARFEQQVERVSDYASRAREAAALAAMPDYIAAAQANMAWIAWRKGSLPEAKQAALEALALWRQSPLVYPFQSLARWPLVAVARAEGRDDEVWTHVRALLAPEQQRLPDTLGATLESSMGFVAAGQGAEATALLDRAISSARSLGYL